MGDNLITLFGGTIETLSRSLNYRSRNHEMILNNVANADTPHYRPFAIDVETAMQKGNQQGQNPEMKRTDENHFPGNKLSQNDSLKSERASYGDPLLFRGDQNGVNIDEEMTDLAKNSLLYRASSQFVAAKFKGLKHALTGGSR